MIAVIAILILSLFSTPTPQPKQYYTYLPSLGITRYAGAQDETTGKYQHLYADDQITKISLRWDLIEAKRGTYAWNIEGNDQAIKTLAKDYRLLIGTRASPKWARLYPDYPCSQPVREYYSDYADFIQAVIERYKPWAVELWNEPDVERGAFGVSWSWMGCWDHGWQYSEMTRFVYSKVKRDDIIIMTGALMLEDDTWAANMLAYEPAGDWISFHAYSYNGVPSGYDLAHDRATWLHRRTDKGVFLSEVSLLDYTGKCTLPFQKAKAEFLEMVNSSLATWGIEGYVWYTIGGNNWRCSDLYPGPAYETYKSLYP